MKYKKIKESTTAEESITMGGNEQKKDKMGTLRQTPVSLKII